MLPRAALRLQLQARSYAFHQHASSRIPASLLLVRTYAKAGKPPPPPPHYAKPPRQPPRPSPAKNTPPTSTSGEVRQTSPGTSLPRDQTWKPRDKITFGGHAASPASAAGAVGAGETVTSARTGPDTPIIGGRPQNAGVAGSTHARNEQVGPMETRAQKENLDNPPEGGQRENAQDKEAATENQSPPPESAPEPEEQLHTPTGPLPDLRQGIPSTFEMEFGQAMKKMDKETASTKPPSQQDEIDGLDITSAPEQSEGRERGEREYSREDYETSLDRRRARVANYLYLTIASLAVVGAAYLARPFVANEQIPGGLEKEDVDGWTPGKMWARVRARFRSQADYYTEPTFPKLLPDVPADQRPMSGMTLVISLEDLLIHSEWSREHGYRTAKRPGVDYFIRYLMPYYELVLFTSAPMMMADPVIRKLDPFRLIQWPLFREATKYDKGDYVKDLSYLNRDLSKVIIVDTNPKHVKNQPENAIVLPKWSGDPRDPHTKDLVALIPFLENLAMSGTQDVREVLKQFQDKDIAAEFAAREAAARDRFNAQVAAQKGRRSGFGLGSLAGGLGMGSGSSGLVAADGTPIESSSQAIAKGKMWSDQIRERGQQQYEALEKRIREEGALWLKEQEEEEKKFMEAQAKEMKKGAFSWFGGK